MGAKTVSQQSVITNSLTRYVLSACFASGIVQDSGSIDTPIFIPALEKQTSEWWANKQSQLIAISGIIEPREGGH